MVKLIAKDSNTQNERMKICPFLIKMFIKENGHHGTSEFLNGNLPSEELRVHTWKNATLEELSVLIKQIYPKFQKKDTIFSFSVVYPDPRLPVYRIKEVGTAISGVKCETDNIMLSDTSFRIGDFIDVAITPPTKQVVVSSQNPRARQSNFRGENRMSVYDRLSKRPMQGN